jgi:hypothetical protein
MTEQEMTMETTVNVSGSRRVCKTVGVDAGLMVIAADRAFPGEEAIDDLDLKDYPTKKRSQRYVISSSGVGDGGYAVVLVERSGTAVGVEVLFISEAAEALADSMQKEIGLESPPSEMWRSEAPADRKAVNAYWEAVQTIFNKAWEQVALSVDPEGIPHVLGTLTIHQGFAIGDPCYGSESAFVSCPAGNYEAIAWTGDVDDWGNRVLRLGVYRMG